MQASEIVMTHGQRGFCAQGSALEPALGLNQGNYGVRLTGQDVERGTFNQRHAALFDQATGQRCKAFYCRFTDSIPYALHTPDRRATSGSSRSARKEQLPRSGNSGQRVFDSLQQVLPRRAQQTSLLIPPRTQGRFGGCFPSALTPSRNRLPVSR